MCVFVCVCVFFPRKFQQGFVYIGWRGTISQSPFAYPGFRPGCVSFPSFDCFSKFWGFFFIFLVCPALFAQQYKEGCVKGGFFLALFTQQCKESCVKGFFFLLRSFTAPFCLISLQVWLCELSRLLLLFHFCWVLLFGFCF